MASIFMVGDTVETLTALDALTTPLPDPQPQFLKYRIKKRLGNMKMKGFGPSTILWEFPLAAVAEVTQVNALQSTTPIYIQSPNEDDVPAVFEVEINVPDPREDGEHKPGFRGHRFGLVVEFVVLSEVAGS